MTKARQKLKDRIFAAYGGYRCACCGEEEPEFLCLHHTNLDGKRHRMDLALQGKALFSWIVEHDFPPMFAVLCYNCHHSLHLKASRGVCAHGRGAVKRIEPTVSAWERRRILSFLEKRGVASWREIQRAHRGIAITRLHSLLDLLVQRGAIELGVVRTRGRPRPTYRLPAINPRTSSA